MPEIDAQTKIWGVRLTRRECARGWAVCAQCQPSSLPGGGWPLHAEHYTWVIFQRQTRKIPTAQGYASRMLTPPIRLHGKQGNENVISAARAGLRQDRRHHSAIVPNMDSSDHKDLFASPSEQRTAARASQQAPKNQYDAEEAREAREAALLRELEGVRNINEVIEGVIGTLERAKGNMGVGTSLLAKRGSAN